MKSSITSHILIGRRNAGHLFHVFIPILIGGCIYLFFRDTNLVIFDWIRQIGLFENITSIRLRITYWNSFLPNWVVFSLPTGLWSYSFLNLVTYTWEKEPIVGDWLCIFFISINLIFESLQASSIVPGTFCLQDISFFILSYFVFLLIKTV